MVGIALLVPYAVTVCPLMAWFGPVRLAAFIAGGFVAAFAVQALDARVRPNADPIARWPLQWAVWALPGLAVFIAEAWATEMPVSTILGSSMRLFVGSVTLGLFASSWVCLELEHEWYLQLQRTGRASPRRYLSIASRIIGFSMRASIGIGLVILTLIFKQLGRPVNAGLLIEVCVVLFGHGRVADAHRHRLPEELRPPLRLTSSTPCRPCAKASSTRPSPW